MSAVIYGLCTAAALVCTCLLLRAYVRNRYRLLLWSGLCFTGLTLNNLLLNRAGSRRSAVLRVPANRRCFMSWPACCRRERAR